MNFELVKSFLEKSTSGVPSDDIDSMPFRFFEPMIMSGLKVDLIERGRVLCSMKVPPRLLNVGNSLHGGATAALVDVVGSSVIMTIEKTTTTGVSVEINVSYLDAAYVGDEIEIEAKALRVGKAVAVVSVEFKNKKTGKIVAQGRHTKYLAVSNLVRYQSPKKPQHSFSSKMSRTFASGESTSGSDARFSANSNSTFEDVASEREEKDIPLLKRSRQRKWRKRQLDQVAIMEKEAESRERVLMKKLAILKSEAVKKGAILDEELRMVEAKRFERDLKFFTQPHNHLSGQHLKIVLDRKQKIAEFNGWEL